MVLHHVCGSFVSMGLVHHVWGPLIIMKLIALLHVFGLLVSVRSGFSIVNLSTCTIFRVWLLFFSASDLSAIVTNTHQFFWPFVIIVFRKKALKNWFAFIVVRKFGWDLCFVILKDLEIFYVKEFLLIFEMNSIDCMAIIAYQYSVQCLRCPLSRFYWASVFI